MREEERKRKEGERKGCKKGGRGSNGITNYETLVSRMVSGRGRGEGGRGKQGAKRKRKCVCEVGGGGGGELR